MADRLWRAQATIALTSGVPEDSITNTWHFDDDDDPVAGPEDTLSWIELKLTDFYQAIDGVLFGNSVGPDVRVKCYDMAEPEPRVPVGEFSIPIVPAGGTTFPSEVALCLSFAAARQSGVPDARRRGRVYIGPIAESCGEMVNSQNRPTTAAKGVLRDAAAALQGGHLHPGSPGFRLRWAIYSPRTRELGGTVGTAFNDVLSGWVDDAWDIQRRRGPRPVARAVFTS